MTNFNVGRRGLLKLIGIAPVAGPALAASVAAASSGSLVGPSAMQMAAAGAVREATGGYASGYGSTSKGVLGKLLWGQLRKEFYARNRRISTKANYRSGVLEHDIASIRSWQPWFKASQQLDRDQAYAAETESLRIKLWPDQDNEMDDD